MAYKKFSTLIENFKHILLFKLFFKILLVFTFPKLTILKSCYTFMNPKWCV